MFNRAHFVHICQSFLAEGCSSLHNIPCDWQLHLPDSQYGLPVLQRTTTYTQNHKSETIDNPALDGTDEDRDGATATSSYESRAFVTCQQFITYSRTFQVPTLYFTMHDTSGAPLTLDEIVHSGLFKGRLLDGMDVSSYAITRPESPFPLLSQGEHPDLGIPCWYLHPCQTGAAVDELVVEANKGRGMDEVKFGDKWLEMWFVVVSAAINWQ